MHFIIESQCSFFYLKYILNVLMKIMKFNSKLFLRNRSISMQIHQKWHATILDALDVIVLILNSFLVCPIWLPVFCFFSFDHLTRSGYRNWFWHGFETISIQHWMKIKPTTYFCPCFLNSFTNKLTTWVVRGQTTVNMCQTVNFPRGSY